jgi:hypothetical protein
MDMDVQHGHSHAAWTRKCIIDMDKHHGHELGRVAWTWTCRFYMEFQNRHEYAALP